MKEPGAFTLLDAALYLFWGAVLSYFFYSGIANGVSDFLKSLLQAGP